VSLIGSPALREIDGAIDTGLFTKSQSTTSAVRAGDLALYFGSVKWGTTATVDQGSQLQTGGNGNASGVINAGTIYGPTTATWTWDVDAGNGEASFIVVLTGH
jgi:hypothetical protein